MHVEVRIGNRVPIFPWKSYGNRSEHNVVIIIIIIIVMRFTSDKSP